MLKIFVALLVGLFVSGCGSVKSSVKPSAMFQTVDQKKAILVQDGSEKKYCIRCSMDLVKFYKTSHSSTHNNIKHQYCSIHCLEDHLKDGISLKNKKVVDISTLKLIDVFDAYYVVGSKKRGTMSRISKYAFSNESDAKEFKSKFGGKIMRFAGALEKAKEDFL